MPPDSTHTSAILGDVVRLMLASPEHKQLSLAEAERRIAPAIRLNQFRVLRTGDGEPLAYLSWARLSGDAEKRLRDGGQALNPKDWSSGDNLWIVDRIAPSKVAEQTLEKLERALFGDAPSRRIGDATPAARIAARTDGGVDAAKPGSVQIRLAETDADLEILTDMIASYHRESRFDGQAAERGVQLDGWRKQWADNPAKYGILIADLNGAAVGVLVAQIGKYAYSDTLAAQCLALYVHPDHRGGFAAVKLLHGFRKWAGKRNIETLTLHVTSGLEAARTDRLLRRFGFAQTGGNYEQKI